MPSDGRHDIVHFKFRSLRMHLHCDTMEHIQQMHVTFPVLAVLIYRTLESLPSRKIEGPLHAYASSIHEGMNPKGDISRANAAALRVCHSK